jgi:hypothetical protein
MPKHPTNGLDYSQQWWITILVDGVDIMVIASYLGRDPYLVVLNAFSESTLTYMTGGRNRFVGTIDGLSCFADQPILRSIFELNYVLHDLQHGAWLELFAIHGFPVIVHYRAIQESSFFAAPWLAGSYEAFRDMEPIDMTGWLLAASRSTIVAKPNVPMILFPVSPIRRAEYVWWLLGVMLHRSNASSACCCREIQQFWHIWISDYLYADPMHCVFNLWNAGLSSALDMREFHFATEGWQDEFWEPPPIVAQHMLDSHDI